MANPDRLLDRLERERRAGYAFDFAGAMSAREQNILEEVTRLRSQWAQRGFERRTPFEAAPAVREAPGVEFRYGGIYPHYCLARHGGIGYTAMSISRLEGFESFEI